MLETLTHETLSQYVDDTFQLEIADQAPIEVRLIEVTATGGTRLERQPFSAIFRGPAEPVLDQAIYGIQHEKLGPLDLFLVPIGATANGELDYEAVFT